MTENATSPDPTMEAITTAVVLGRDGEKESARHDLLAIWKQIGLAGDPFHCCTLAHYLADLYEDPAAALMWDVRALDAANLLSDDRAQQYHASLHVAGFYPSLYVNIADNLRRLGSFDAATEHIENAEQHTASLNDDAYGDMIRAAIIEVRQAIDRRDTARRASAPSPAQ
ncbi:hypothetical protein BN970_03550 [Mycolicibacterium conceptionense]|uniref:Tetratricopeptide repeat protein n=1 Tax=Mycolicibacterium conceptionense TaxID=451644 RepID=A0A0U1DJH2_9MYCO|nr:hypothetical protein [Mycolicibacterium conceptionense]ORV24655.1 hypothetical protein AWB98_20660 [Mycolicibacterium conceptionense]CQD16634.1 hypothetical protein BN970_03550 [Mycolicibacterium conceptionense]